MGFEMDFTVLRKDGHAILLVIYQGDPIMHSSCIIIAGVKSSLFRSDHIEKITALCLEKK